MESLAGRDGGSNCFPGHAPRPTAPLRSQRREKWQGGALGHAWGGRGKTQGIATGNRPAHRTFIAAQNYPPQGFAAWPDADGWTGVGGVKCLDRPAPETDLFPKFLHAQVLEGGVVYFMQWRGSANVPPLSDLVPPNVPPHIPGLRHTCTDFGERCKDSHRGEKEKGRKATNLHDLECGPPTELTLCLASRMNPRVQS